MGIWHFIVLFLTAAGELVVILKEKPNYEYTQPQRVTAII